MRIQMERGEMEITGLLIYINSNQLSSSARNKDTHISVSKLTDTAQLRSDA